MFLCNLTNGTAGNETISEDIERRDELYVVIPITALYALIFFTGVIGNVSTCIVIARNKSMHTATNYYLFSLAVSDLLLLTSGLPPEIYRLWWPQDYVFGEAFCVLQSFAAETSANATVLTITAFTAERYIAICHPFLTHTMSKLSRAIKFVMAIWLVALCLAVPQAIQYGVLYTVNDEGTAVSKCTMTWTLMEYAFEVSTLLFFVGPMTVITVLYVLIGLKLRHSRLMTLVNRSSTNNEDIGNHRIGHRSSAAQNRVIKMLVAVVVAFFVCWAPFHAQRLLAVYINYLCRGRPSEAALSTYLVLNYTSGVLYYLSTTVNPLLYNIMSNKFREAFKSTLAQLCVRHRGHSSHLRTYSTLSRCAPSLRNYQRSVSDGVQPVPPTKATDNPLDASLIHLHNSGHVSKTLTDKRKNFRTRGSSESSQTTVLTTTGGMVESKLERTRTAGRRRRRQARKCRNPPVGVSLGAIAQRLRTTIFKSEKVPVRFLPAHKSIESANTISNSSLQDMDETEFSSSDLVKYMAEINQDLT